MKPTSEDNTLTPEQVLESIIQLLQRKGTQIDYYQYALGARRQYDADTGFLGLQPSGKMTILLNLHWTEQPPYDPTTEILPHFTVPTWGIECASATAVADPWR